MQPDEQDQPISPVTNTDESVEAHQDISPINHQAEQEQEQEPKPESVQVANDTDTTSKQGNWLHRHKKPVIIVAILALLVGGGVTTYALTQKKSPVAKTDDSKKVSQKTDATFDYTFFDEAKSIEPIKLFKDLSFNGQNCEGPNNDQNCKDNVQASDIAYWQVGTTGKTGRLIIVSTPDIVGSSQTLVKQEGEQITVLANALDLTKSYYLDKDGSVSQEMSMVKSLADTVEIDNKTTFKELQFPTDVEVKGQKLQATNPTPYFLVSGLSSISGYWFNSKSIEEKDISKIDTKDDKTYYQVVSEDKGFYQTRNFYGTYKKIIATAYYQNGEIAGAKDALNIKWTSGEQNSNTYLSAGRGCGSTTGFVVATNVNASQLKQVGTTSGGQKVYQLPSDNPIVTDLFEEDYAKGQYLGDASANKNLTLQQFTDKHAYFLAENALGDYVVFLRSDLFVRGGCGKPVVYLYPTKPTKIDVAVGADVTISDPLYPKGGWKNVLAQPDGRLTYNGKQYSSLFWEGYGHGEYPEITFGSVVARSNAVETIRTQLKQQGLQGQEITDFIEFWEPRLPNTPYVRLSWLSKAQLDRLAPLDITPAPQTTIRVFLDFEGLQQPVALTSQRFGTPKRNGFTVVEWGGLARNGLQAL